LSEISSPDQRNANLNNRVWSLLDIAATKNEDGQLKRFHGIKRKKKKKVFFFFFLFPCHAAEIETRTSKWSKSDFQVFRRRGTKRTREPAAQRLHHPRFVFVFFVFCLSFWAQWVFIYFLFIVFNVILGAMYELNLDHGDREKLKKEIGAGVFSPAMMDRADRHCTDLLRHSVFPLWKASKPVKEFLKRRKVNDIMELRTSARAPKPHGSRGHLEEKTSLDINLEHV
jgi:hypothetical protein